MHFQGGFISNRVCTNWTRVARISRGKSRAILDTAPITNVPDEEKIDSTDGISVVSIPKMVDAAKLGKGARSLGDEKFSFDNEIIDYDGEDEIEGDADDDDDLEEEEDDEDDEIEDDLEQIDLEEDDDDALIVSKTGGLDDFGDDDDDDDVRLSTVSSRSRRKRRQKPIRPDVTLSGMDIDANDEIPDEEEELLEVDPDLLGIGNTLSPRKSKTIVPGDAEDEPTSSDLLIDEEFDDPSEAELQSAAEMLTGTGLLGRTSRADDGEEDEKPRRRKASTEGKKSTRARKSKGKSAILDDDEMSSDLGLLDTGTELQDEKPLGLDGYRDLDDEEEAEFTLTSNREGSFGRLWELNEDSYITITEPGQAYGYELDITDSDDQEMASVRRGSLGGWGSGLQNDAKNKYPKGSREWVARRSYDLLAKASPREMRIWTKRHGSPPDVINELFPKPRGPQAILGVAELNTEAFEAEPSPASQLGRSIESTRSIDFENEEGIPGEDDSGGSSQAQSALERAIKFPCSFKFKVEGTGGEGLIDSLANDVQIVLNQKLPRSAFKQEPSGRYTRVIFSVEVAEAKHVTDLYDAFRQNPLVKFSYG